MLREQYLQNLENNVPYPIFIERVIEPNTDVNCRAVRLMSEVSRLLSGEGVEPFWLGSASILLQIGEAFTRSVHDVDFIVPNEQIIGVAKVLRNSGFKVWNEDSIHRSTRNLTGGFGRHHNWGASNRKYLQLNELPIWTGIFNMHLDQNMTEFKELYAISSYKIQLALKNVLAIVRDDVDPKISNTIQTFIKQPLSFDNMVIVIDIISSLGFNFWEIINNNDINEADIERRKRMTPQMSEKFLEVEMTQTSYTEPEIIMDTKAVTVYDTDLLLCSLANSFLRMKFYPPHYLGLRKKYVDTAEMIESSQKLDAKVDTQRQILNDRSTTHEPTGVFDFRCDMSMSVEGYLFDDKEELSLQLGVDPNVDYWALLLEGVHFAYV